MMKRIMAGLAVAALAVAPGAEALGRDGRGKAEVRVAGVMSVAAVERIARRVANREITKRAPGLSLSSAATAVTAQTAGSANTAVTAQTAGSANTAGISENASIASFASSSNTATTAKNADASTTAQYANMSDTAITAEHANTADTAQTASFAVSANPVMFARVRGEDGFVYPEYSKGITQANIEKIGASPTGNIHCLSGLPPIRGGSVTIDARDSQETTTAPEFGFGVPINLGPGKDIIVRSTRKRMFGREGGPAAPQNNAFLGFFLILY
jgi:hypothetical protein